MKGQTFFPQILPSEEKLPPPVPLTLWLSLAGGPNLVLFNSLSRTMPKGIQIGQDSKPLVLRLDEDFDKVYHYDVPCALHRIEVGNCFCAVSACISNITLL